MAMRYIGTLDIGARRQLSSTHIRRPRRRREGHEWEKTAHHCSLGHTKRVQRNNFSSQTTAGSQLYYRHTQDKTGKMIYLSTGTYHRQIDDRSVSSPDPFVFLLRHNGKPICFLTRSKLKEFRGAAVGRGGLSTFKNKNGPWFLNSFWDQWPRLLPDVIIVSKNGPPTETTICTANHGWISLSFCSQLPPSSGGRKQNWRQAEGEDHKNRYLWQEQAVAISEETVYVCLKQNCRIPVSFVRMLKITAPSFVSFFSFWFWSRNKFYPRRL